MAEKAQENTQPNDRQEKKRLSPPKAVAAALGLAAVTGFVGFIAGHNSAPDQAPQAAAAASASPSPEATSEPEAQLVPGSVKLKNEKLATTPEKVDGQLSMGEKTPCYDGMMIYSDPIDPDRDQQVTSVWRPPLRVINGKLFAVTTAPEFKPINSPVPLEYTQLGMSETVTQFIPANPKKPRIIECAYNGQETLEPGDEDGGTGMPTLELSMKQGVNREAARIPFSAKGLTNAFAVNGRYYGSLSSAEAQASLKDFGLTTKSESADDVLRAATTQE